MKKKTTNSKKAKKIICKHIFTLESPMEILYQMKQVLKQTKDKEKTYYIMANKLFKKAIKVGMKNINQLYFMLEEKDIKIGESNFKDNKTIQKWYRNMIKNGLKHWYVIERYKYKGTLEAWHRERYDNPYFGGLTEENIYNIKKFDVITTYGFSFRNEAGGSELDRGEVRAEIIRFFDDYEVGRRFVAKIYLEKDIEKLKKERYESVLRNYRNDLEAGKRKLEKLKASDYTPRMVYFTEHDVKKIQKFKI